MCGSPLFRALAAFLVIAALGWPLGKLTHRGAASPMAPTSGGKDEALIKVAISFTHLPRHVSLWHLGVEKWSADVKDAEVLEAELKLPWPAEGIDLRVVVDWPEGTPLAAARLRVIDPEGTEHVGSIFSKGPADEVLTFD